MATNITLSATNIVERLRSVYSDTPIHQFPALAAEAADEIERLRKADGWMRMTLPEYEERIEKLEEALRQIIAEADSDDGLTAWDGSDIARRALTPPSAGSASQDSASGIPAPAGLSTAARQT